LIFNTDNFPIYKGTTFDGNASGLGIPIAAQTRVLVVFSLSSENIQDIPAVSVPAYFSAGLSFV